MTKFGINTFLFTGSFTNDSISLFSRFKDWGFDSVEIAIDDPTVLDVQLINKGLTENGLVCGSACAAMGPGRDLRGTVEEQETAIRYLESCVALLAEINCPVLVGPLYSSVGRAAFEEKAAREEQWHTVVNHLRHLGSYAEDCGVTLAIEPLNRYETDFINTASQALELVDEIGLPSVKVHLDSYHMNIEEKYPAEAILRTGRQLAHFHACGVDRGAPGNDHTDWLKVIDALKKIDYQGDIVIESFTPDVKVIAKAASIWRTTEPSQESIARKGLDFLREQWDRR